MGWFGRFLPAGQCPANRTFAGPKANGGHSGLAFGNPNRPIHRRVPISRCPLPLRRCHVAVFSTEARRWFGSARPGSNFQDGSSRERRAGSGKAEGDVAEGGLGSHRVFKRLEFLLVLHLTLGRGQLGAEHREER